jgi:hypothetical protein
MSKTEPTQVFVFTHQSTVGKIQDFYSSPDGFLFNEIFRWDQRVNFLKFGGGDCPQLEDLSSFTGGFTRHVKSLAGLKDVMGQFALYSFEFMKCYITGA